MRANRQGRRQQPVSEFETREHYPLAAERQQRCANRYFVGVIPLVDPKTKSKLAYNRLFTDEYRVRFFVTLTMRSLKEDWLPKDQNRVYGLLHLRNME